MKYDIQHTCGHIYTYNIYGTNVRGERNRRRDFLASTSCTDCETKDLIEALKSRFCGIPDITQGSAKQVAWAVSIRFDAANKLQDLADLINQDIAPTNPKMAEIGLEIIKETLWNTSFQFWIDNRGEAFDKNWINKKAQQRLS